jgi:hypothetical protein
MRSHPGLHPDFLTADDAALIREFIAEKRASVGICTGRANMLSFTVIGWRRFIGPYRELTIGDVYAGIDSLKSGKSQKGKPFKQNTLADHVPSAGPGSCSDSSLCSPVFLSFC